MKSGNLGAARNFFVQSISITNDMVQNVMTVSANSDLLLSQKKINRQKLFIYIYLSISIYTIFNCE